MSIFSSTNKEGSCKNPEYVKLKSGGYNLTFVPRNYKSFKKCSLASQRIDRQIGQLGWVSQQINT